MQRLIILNEYDAEVVSAYINLKIVEIRVGNERNTNFGKA